MIRERMRIDRFRTWIGMAVLLLAFAVSPAVRVQAAQITIDGDPQEWTGVDMQNSSDSAVAKWAVMQDDDYVYFYVQQNGGNEYYLPISNTNIDIKYASGQGGSNTQIRFTYMMQEFKNAWYGDITGVKKAYAPSKEANKYEIEFAIPKSFFSEDDYTITYGGTSVKSSDIKHVKDHEQPTPTAAVYEGITIDGTFTDWDSISKKKIDDRWIEETAAGFVGDSLSR